MRIAISAIIAALVASVAAAPAFTNSEFGTLEEGKPFTLTWSGASGPVTITIANGDPKDLKVVATVTKDATGTSFTWTPPAGSLASGTYAFEITDSTGTNYSAMFSYKGTGTVSSSASKAATTSTSVVSTSTSVSTTVSSSVSSASSTGSTTSTKSSSTSSAPTSSGTSKPPANTNDSPKYKSPLAFVLVSVAALLYFN